MDSVIRVSHVKKVYKMYNDPKDRFKEAAFKPAADPVYGNNNPLHSQYHL